MLTTILIFVFVLGVLVFVHELGHFIAARRMGVRVDEFGFGFPPRLFGVKRGNTVYSINLVPFGGFVKIRGETGEASNAPDSFASKKTWQKITILSAGVFMNFVLAFMLYTVAFVTGIPQQVTDEDLATKDVRDVSIVIAEVAPGSAADQAGIRIGDSLLAIDGVRFDTPDQAVNHIQQNADAELTLLLKRGKIDVEVQAKPALYEDSKRPILGISMVRSGLVRYNVFQAIYNGFKATITVIVLVLMAFGKIFAGLFSGQGLGHQISGPVGVAVLTGQVAQLGVGYLLNFMALLSINLGILNIIPFPALDGGRVLFAIIEKIKGRPLSAKLESSFHNIGFSLLILLIIFVTYKDLLKYGSRIWSQLSQFLG